MGTIPALAAVHLSESTPEDMGNQMSGDWGSWGDRMTDEHVAARRRRSPMLKVVSDCLANPIRQRQHAATARFACDDADRTASPINVVELESHDLTDAEAERHLAEDHRVIPAASGCGTVEEVKERAQLQLTHHPRKYASPLLTEAWDSEQQAGRAVTLKLKPAQQTAYASCSRCNSRPETGLPKLGDERADVLGP